MKSKNTFEYHFTVKEHHLDTFGHVNHATYLQLLEEARWEIIEKNGYGLEEIQKTQVGPVILGVDIKYKREIKNREKIKVQTRASGLDKKVQVIEQRMLNEQDEECCFALIHCGLFDMKQRKLLAPTPEWRRALQSD